MKHIMITLGFAVLALTASAQKFGYVNSAQVMSLLPEVKEANSSLEVFQKQYEARLKSMIEEYQQKGMALQTKVQQGEIAPKQQEEETKKLQDLETQIGTLEQEMRQKVAEKQESLIAPIIEKMQNAIDSVAAEGGYQYIFDASPGNGILLYAEQNLDVTPMVMAKMGISMPTEEPAAEK